MEWRWRQKAREEAVAVVQTRGDKRLLTTGRVGVGGKDGASAVRSRVSKTDGDR